MSERFKKTCSSQQLEVYSVVKNLCGKLDCYALLEFPMDKGKSYSVFDIFIPGLNIAIEIDGGVHEKTENKDCNRDIYWMSRGILTHRITNEEIDNVNGAILSERFLALFKSIITSNIKNVDVVRKNRNSRLCNMIYNICTTIPFEEAEDFICNSINGMVSTEKSISYWKEKEIIINKILKKRPGVKKRINKGIVR